MTFRDLTVSFPILTDLFLPRSVWCFWLVEANFPRATTNQKHCPDLSSDASSVWNFCAPFSDVISRENQWWRHEMFSLRSKRFRAVSEQTENPVRPSFFAPKPNGNACYTGYEMFGCFLRLAKLLCRSSTVILSFFHFETYCSIFDLATLQKSLLKQNWRDQSFSTHTWKVFPSYHKVNSVNRWDVYMKFSVRKENPWSWALSEKLKKA